MTEGSDFDGTDHGMNDPGRAIGTDGTFDPRYDLGSVAPFPPVDVHGFDPTTGTFSGHSDAPTEVEGPVAPAEYVIRNGDISAPSASTDETVATVADTADTMGGALPAATSNVDPDIPEVYLNSNGALSNRNIASPVTTDPSYVIGGNGVIGAPAEPEVAAGAGTAPSGRSRATPGARRDTPAGIGGVMSAASRLDSGPRASSTTSTARGATAAVKFQHGPVRRTARR